MSQIAFRRQAGFDHFHAIHTFLASQAKNPYNSQLAGVVAHRAGEGRKVEILTIFQLTTLLKPLG
jgi:hypothetical protein